MIGGQAKTLMFVHISPEVNAIGETISTLKFAERVASIELGAARSNKETGEIRELKEEVGFKLLNDNSRCYFLDENCCDLLCCDKTILNILFPL